MDLILSEIGLCSIIILIIFVIKKVDEYLYFRKEDSICYKFDKDDKED